jgi:hypothetical protein
MYIPTWILIIIVAGIFYYFYTRKKSNDTESINPSSSTITTINKNKKEDWLGSDNWKETAIEHLSKFPQRTGRQSPTYEEMLDLEEDEFKAWLFVKGDKTNQDEFLKEMIKHETQTGSFAKTGRENDPPHVKMIVDVFDKDKSEEIVNALRKLSDTSNELIDKGADGEKGDIVQQSIWAKGTSDYYKLGEK